MPSTPPGWLCPPTSNHNDDVDRLPFQYHFAQDSPFTAPTLRAVDGPLPPNGTTAVTPTSVRLSGRANAPLPGQGASG
jgi:hypothetical protein